MDSHPTVEALQEKITAMEEGVGIYRDGDGMRTACEHLAALHDRLGVDIPEPDYPQIATLSLAGPYLAARAA